jgi:hypothetical protein
MKINDNVTWKNMPIIILSIAYTTLILFIVGYLIVNYRFNGKSIEIALGYSALAFGSCLFLVFYLYFSKGGSSRFSYFMLSFMLTLSAIMFYSVLSDLTKGKVARAELENYFNFSNFPGKEIIQVIIFYSKDIASLAFAAIGASSIATAIREKSDSASNDDRANSPPIASIAIEDTSKNQYINYSEEKDRSKENNYLLFICIILNFYLISKKDK